MPISLAFSSTSSTSIPAALHLLWPVLPPHARSLEIETTGLWPPSRVVHMMHAIGPLHTIALTDGARVNQPLVDAIRVSAGTLRVLKLGGAEFFDDAAFVEGVMAACARLEVLELDGAFQTWRYVRDCLLVG